jgi:hypothetical protein
MWARSDECIALVGTGSRQVVMESVTSDKSKWLVASALFAFCVAPTFISYQQYLFTWTMPTTCKGP